MTRLILSPPTRPLAYIPITSMVDVLRSIHEIDSFITQSQHLLSVLPRSHPLHHTCIYSLATARVDRYQLSNQKDDLDKAILHFTRSDTPSTLVLARTRIQTKYSPNFPRLDTLRTAASSGPVVIINHTIWRSDILILLHNTSPPLIPTPRDFYECATASRDKLLHSRSRYGPSRFRSSRPNSSL